MKTVKETVANGNRITDEQRGHFERRIDDLIRRINDKTLDYQAVMDNIQLIIENEDLEVAKKILKFVGTTKSVGAKKFIAREKFCEGKGTDGVKITWIGNNFKEHFLGKEEFDVPNSDLKIHRLREYSNDISIITKLGGEDVAKSYLAHLWSDLKAQVYGEDGPLLTNGYVNIRYILDVNGILSAVYAHWRSSSKGWHVDSRSFGYRDRWDIGSRVFSGASDQKPEESLFLSI